VHFWLWLNVGLTVLLFTVTLVFLVRRARREHRMTPELALYLATLSLGWMEAVIDWGAFVYYSPEWPHFPTGLPVVRLIPILPLHIPLCYTWFFFGGAWLAVRLARALVQRFPGWRMGPTLLLAGFGVGFLLDFAVENFFISVGGLWTYTQTWAPLTLRAGTDTQWPVYMGFAMALTIAPLAYLLGTRDDRGEDRLQNLVDRATGSRVRAPATAPVGLAMAGVGASTLAGEPRVPARPATPVRRQHWVLYLLSWVVVVHLIYGAVSLGYAALRWSGVQTSVSTVKPYPNGKAWFDDDVTRPDDPTLNRAPIQKSIDAGLEP
jgi:Spirocyclase AveC-like